MFSWLENVALGVHLGLDICAATIHLYVNLLVMQVIIEKENNFKQAGERYRSWAPDRYLLTTVS